MMVEQPRNVDPLGTFNKSLDEATAKLHEYSGKKTATTQEVNELLSALDQANSSMQSANLREKKVVPEEINRRIENALLAVALFQTTGAKTMQQAIASITSSALSNSLKDFGKNLRNLKKHRIGRRVEKIEETKKSSEKKGES